MQDYINNFEDVTTHTAFIDVDELYFSKNNLKMEEYVNDRSLSGYTSVRMKQIKFLNRFCAPGSRAMDLDLFLEANTTLWAEKLII